jgi:hypothetical protein
MIQHIQAALERHLMALAPQFPTAFENLEFTPATGQAFQRVHMLINAPVDHAVTLDVLEQRGVFQVSLFYPLNAGRLAAQQRATAIAEHFAPPQTLAEQGVKVDLLSTARIASGMPDGDRWHVPVSIYWRSFKTKA